VSAIPPTVADLYLAAVGDLKAERQNSARLADALIDTLGSLRAIESCSPRLAVERGEGSLEVHRKRRARQLDEDERRIDEALEARRRREATS